jgi:cytochrome P450
MYLYSNEVIGQIVYGKRLGNFETNNNSSSSTDAKEFFDNLYTSFTLLGELQFSLPFYNFFRTKKYKLMDKSIENLERIGYKYIAESDKYHQQQQQQQLNSNSNNSNSNNNYLISHLRESKQSDERINRNAITLFMAGSDSTTHSIMWLLHNLGLNLDVQQKVREEVIKVLSEKNSKNNKDNKDDDNEINGNDIHNMPYLRATFKESLRYTPTAAGVVRVLKTECQVGDYLVPANTMITMLSFISNKKNEYFKDAEKFMPERWLEADKNNRPHPYAHLPFGFGIHIHI